MTSKTREEMLLQTTMALGTGLAITLLASCHHLPGRKDPVAIAAPDVIKAEAPETASNAPETLQEEVGKFRVTPPPKVTNAALMPLEDIGLMREKVPPTLKSIKTPYANETAPTCESLGSAILALDLVLGPDVDVRLADETLRQKGMGAAGDALVDAIESTSTSVVPFRGWVRELSGASSRQRRMAAAIQAGRLRRAYLKGIGQAMQCLPPAAPLPYVEK